MQITRRQILKHFGSGIACFAVSDFVGLSVAFGQGGAETLDREFDYRSWEDLFRKKWTWDKIAYATHSVGCSAQCQWGIFVKDGVAFKEEQVEHPRSRDPETPDPGPQGCQRGACFTNHMYGPDRITPDPGPQGCQRGACFTNHMYGPDRIKYPLKRVGKRGEGKWKRVSWDEALTEAADAIIDACVQDGPRSIINDYGDETEYAWRNFYKQLGNIQMDSPVSNGDHHMGNYQTFGNFGLPTVSRRGPDFFKSELIFIWHWNPIYTQIPYYKLFSQAHVQGDRG
jgi:anaerobic selenocysteine-containing dehydrogenase